MSETTGAAGTEAFAGLLRELKDRSGLSYGALAKRMHMSTSTLHRYCNGTAVPVDYAPVERLARVCRATPQELVELHRRWILADATRGRAKGDPATEAGSAQGAGTPGWAQAAGTAASGRAAPHGRDAGEDGGEGPGAGADARPGGRGGNGEPVVVDLPGGPAGPRRPRRRRTVLITAVSVAALLGAVVLAVHPPSGWGGQDTGGQQAAGDSAPDPSTTASRSPKRHAPPASSSPSARKPEGAASGTSKGDGKQGAGKPPGGGTGADPLTVRTRPYVYEDPCSQHFLLDSDPKHVGPPANEQDAPRWASAYGAVASDAQRVALTVQGTGKQTVVLEALHVHVLTKGAPLAWNDYSMGVGCGGGVGTKSFDIALDAGSPTVAVKNGQRDFPYKVSESDPEVFYVTAHTAAHDVRWDLTLDWSQGSRRGSIHIDNSGSAFRTSADADRPGYDYPNGGGEWIARQE